MSCRLMAPLTRELSKRWAVQSGALHQPPPPSNRIVNVRSLRRCTNRREIFLRCRSANLGHQDSELIDAKEPASLGISLETS